MGEIESANRMFGFPYRVEGQVVQGNKLGRSIGFPTLNLPWLPEARPAYGVYLVEVSFPEKKRVRPWRRQLRSSPNRRAWRSS